MYKVFHVVPVLGIFIHVPFASLKADSGSLQLAELQWARCDQFEGLVGVSGSVFEGRIMLP